MASELANCRQDDIQEDFKELNSLIKSVTRETSISLGCLTDKKMMLV